MPNPSPPSSNDSSERAWCDVHEVSGRPWPRGVPVAEERGNPRAYAWSVPGLGVRGAPAVIAGRSVGEAARRLVRVARESGVVDPSRRALAMVLHELAPGREEAIGAGRWPTDGVVRRIAVTVTLERGAVSPER